MSLSEAFDRLKDATNKRRIATMKRKWVESSPKLNIMNYWFYALFTNDFILYIIDHPEEQDGIN